tara:strand:- start:263 stop:496 length:234 start_codon:yes stop_codon:yes gene_type:complete
MAPVAVIGKDIPAQMRRYPLDVVLKLLLARKLILQIGIAYERRHQMAKDDEQSHDFSPSSAGHETKVGGFDIQSNEM